MENSKPTQIVSLDSLTAEQRDQLVREHLAKVKSEENARRGNISAYDALRNDTIEELYPKLLEASKRLADVKAEVFEKTRQLVEMKADLLNRKDVQKSDKFTNIKNTMSITVGYNEVDEWGTGANVAKEHINDWLISKVSGGNPIIIKLVEVLLKANKEGNMSLQKVTILRNSAAGSDETELTRYIDLMLESYQPKPSSVFIKARHKDVNNQWQELGLSITAV